MPSYPYPQDLKSDDALDKATRRAYTNIMSYAMSLLHTIIAWFLSPLTQIVPKIRGGFWQRHGIFKLPSAPKLGKRIWFHGASAGDVLALVPTARALKSADSNLDICLTTITDSGYSMGKKYLDEGLLQHVNYAPWDYPLAVHRYIEHFQPDALVLEYTELWPALIHTSADWDLKTFMHNARFSPKNTRKYHWLFRLYGNLLQRMSALLLRDGTERDRALGLEAIPRTLKVTGNTKLDHSLTEESPDRIEELRQALKFKEEDLVWVCGSTHDGEEEILLDIFTEARARFPQLKLLLAPRYIDRTQRVRELCEARALDVSLREGVSGIDSPVILLNSVGELSACYHLADLVFVGGSFNQRGGHNIIEPAMTGVPVLFGPNMWNVVDSVQLLLGTGGVQVENSARLKQAVFDLLENDSLRHELGQRARERIHQASGAAERNSRAILDSLT